MFAHLHHRLSKESSFDPGMIDTGVQRAMKTRRLEESVQSKINNKQDPVFDLLQHIYGRLNPVFVVYYARSSCIRTLYTVCSLSMQPTLITAPFRLSIADGSLASIVGMIVCIAFEILCSCMILACLILPNLFIDYEQRLLNHPV